MRGWRALVGVAVLFGGEVGLAQEAAALKEARVEVFSPRGSAKQVRQVTARFSVGMVAIGDPRLADPFAVDCAAPGKGRWADGRNWVYDFEAELRAGVRCRFTLKAGVKALDGREISGTRAFTFDTGGPAIQGSFPRDGWEAVDEDQAFLLRLDAPATPETVRANAYCVVDGISERVPIELVSGDARRTLLEQRKQLGYAYYELLWKSGDTTQARVRDRSLEQAEELISVVKCARRLPPATKLQLVWGAGIAAPGGITTRRAQQLAFQVRASFTASLECTRTEPRAGCTPTSPIVVRFSAPVPQAQAFAARLRIGSSEVRQPDPGQNKQAKVVESITFKAPFPDGATATLELPAQLADDSGRTLANAARFPLEVRIDEYPPLVKFSGEFGILEATEGGVLPVTLRNLDATPSPNAAAIPGRQIRVGGDPQAIASWLRRVHEANRARGEYVRDAAGESKWREDTGSTSVFTASDGTTALSIRKPEGARPAEVVGIPLGGAGLYVVELESRRLGASLLGRDTPRYVAASALVTNVSVHFKWGRESSLVWVTRLDNAQPIADAQVVITDYCKDTERWRGTTDRNGIAAIEQALGDPHDEDACSQYSESPLLITATAPAAPAKGGAIARQISALRCRAGTKASRRTSSVSTPARAGSSRSITPCSTVRCSARAKRCR